MGREGGATGSGARRRGRVVAYAYLVHRVARQDGATKVPVLENALLERDERAAGALRPQLAEDHTFGDGMLGDAGGSTISISGRKALTCRPGEGNGEAEKDKEEELVGLRKDEEGVALVVDAGHGAIAHLWG